MAATWSLHDSTSGTVLGTFPSRARANAGVAKVAAGHEWTVWEWADSMSPTGAVVAEGVGPFLDPFPQ